MATIHTLDPERRSSKEKEFTNKLINLVDEFKGEMPLISFIGIMELIKLDVTANQKELITQK
jgi:hypothetical protein